MADKLDSYDVAALERSLNDSATRVSTIWVSFLLFGVYLAIAAGGVTHVQLLLESPIRLPVLNVDLPFTSFFVIAPTLFVVTHLYLLLQLILLARTAAAYNEAIENAKIDFPASERIRQRLANTLFAQFLAGSIRERSGTIGAVLQLIAWSTLIIAPILVLFVFQLTFLPYHHSGITWIHRALVAADSFLVLMFWPVAFDGRRDLKLRNALRYPPAIAAYVCLLFFSAVTLSFPGEAQAGWSRRLTDFSPYSPRAPSECRSVSYFAGALPAGFDRLLLANVIAVEAEKVAKIEAADKNRVYAAAAGEWTRSFENRDLRCALFSGGDFRRANFTSANLSGAGFSFSLMQSATLDYSSLNGADLALTQLQGASLRGADLRNADFSGARMQGATLSSANLQAARLSNARLQGANLASARLQGASLGSASLQLADLFGAHLQGAYLSNARLEGARMIDSRLQGADIDRAAFDATNLSGAFIQDADIDGARLNLTDLSGAYVFNARAPNCSTAYLSKVNVKSVVPIKPAADPDAKEQIVGASQESIRLFIEQTLDGVPHDEVADLRRRLGRALPVQEPNDQPRQAQAWSRCVEKREAKEEYDRKVAEKLIDIACRADPTEPFMVNRLFLTRIDTRMDDDSFVMTIAAALLGQSKNPCPAAVGLHPDFKERLRSTLERQQ